MMQESGGDSLSLTLQFKLNHPGESRVLRARIPILYPITMKGPPWPCNSTALLYKDLDQLLGFLKDQSPLVRLILMDHAQVFNLVVC